VGFLVKGCKGDRTPMYRAFAPFFEGVKGDRRVTGTRRGSAASGAEFSPAGKPPATDGADEEAVSAASGGAFAPFFMAIMGDRRMTADVKIALYGIEFSREFSAVSTRWDV